MSMSKSSSNPSAASANRRPIMVLLEALGQRWALRVLWELRDGPLTFRALQARCADVSPTSLNRRLKELRDLELVDHEPGGYSLTAHGEALGVQLMKMSRWAEQWDRARH